jgi:hypothetical protein
VWFARAFAKLHLESFSSEIVCTNSSLCVWEEHKKFLSYNIIFLRVIAHCIMGFTILSHAHRETFKSRLEAYSMETMLNIICGNEI